MRPSFRTRQFSTGSFTSLTRWSHSWRNSNAHRATNMSSKMRVRWLVVAAVLAVAQSASVAVQAQFWNWNQQDQSNRQRSRPQSGRFFDWFGGGQYNSRPRDDEYYRPPRHRQRTQQQQPNQHTQQELSESPRAPPAKKAEVKDEQTGPRTSI